LVVSLVLDRHTNPTKLSSPSSFAHFSLRDE